jgi:hypothetical protein
MVLMITATPFEKELGGPVSVSTFGSGSCWWADVVHFLKTDTRRYGVPRRAGERAECMADPAPGYDDFLSHELLYFVAEAE